MIFKIQPPFGRFAGSCSRSIPKLLLNHAFLALVRVTTTGFPRYPSERGIPEVFLLPALGNWSATLSSIHPGCFKAASNRSITSCGDTDGSGSTSEFKVFKFKSCVEYSPGPVFSPGFRLVRGTWQKASTDPRISSLNGLQANSTSRSSESLLPIHFYFSCTTLDDATW
jgi:hypothetical protein